MINKELILCGICGHEFHLDLSRPSRYTTKKSDKNIWICPECRKILVGEG